MSKPKYVFKDGKWVEEEKSSSALPFNKPVNQPPFKPNPPAKPSIKPPTPIKAAVTPKYVFKDGKWVADSTNAPAPAPAPVSVYVDPRDVEPKAPLPPANDADRPRWVQENVQYMDQLSRYRDYQAFKAQHPELVKRG